MTKEHELEIVLRDRQPTLAEPMVHAVLRFYGLVLAGNELQNLTRLITPKDFYEGHVLDAVELLKTGFLEFPAMDLGSGVGVPGLLCAILGPGDWVLAESEKRKAEFLRSTAESLGLSQVQVWPGRGEEYLKQSRVGSVVVRAVGPLERIYSWIGECSTWNNLILMKGPRWDEEWASFQGTSEGQELRATGEYSYLAGEEMKKRRILRLNRT